MSIADSAFEWVAGVSISLALLFCGVVTFLKMDSGSEPPPVANLQVNKSDQVFPGMVLAPMEGNAEVHLINGAGQVVHRWKVDATRARLLPNGHLLVVHGSRWGKRHPDWRPLRPVVKEYDWNGKVVWSHTVDDIAHHDVQRLPNGNTLIVKRVMVPDELRQKVKNPVRRKQPIRSDAIVEVDPNGQVVWEWQAHEHLDLNSCGGRECRIPEDDDKPRKGVWDWSHLNTVTVIPENKWFDAGHQAFRPGNLMIMLRSWWAAMIIDKQTKEVVWEYSGGDYKGGMSAPHEAHVIAKGYPGAGNVLIFDNGRGTHDGSSFILEIDPITKKLMWVYDAGEEFFSKARGSVQRLPNGNTFISEDNRNRCFEVSAAKEVVWSYKADLAVNRCAKYALDFAPQFQQVASR